MKKILLTFSIAFLLLAPVGVTFAFTLGDANIYPINRGGGSGGSTTAVEIPTPATGDGSNRVFTFTHTPLFVAVGSSGTLYFQNFGYSLSGTTVTFDTDATPVNGQIVRSIYTTSTPTGDHLTNDSGTVLTDDSASQLTPN